MKDSVITRHSTHVALRRSSWIDTHNHIYELVGGLTTSVQAVEAPMHGTQVVEHLDLPQWELTLADSSA